MSVCLCVSVLVSKRYERYPKSIFYFISLRRYIRYLDTEIRYIFPCGGRCAPPRSPANDVCFIFYISTQVQYWVDMDRTCTYVMGWGAWGGAQRPPQGKIYLGNSSIYWCKSRSNFKICVILVLVSNPGGLVGAQRRLVYLTPILYASYLLKRINSF